MSSNEKAEGSRGGLFGAGGRFVGGTDPVMEKFNESLSFDRRMWDQDIRGSIAYAKAIHKCGLLTDEELSSLVDGLGRVREEWREGTFVEKPGDEDIHTANERRLTELVGPVGGKLHTGRSRNDQVATDARLWTVEAETKILHLLGELLMVAADAALRHVDLLVAGYTHLQPAQPVRFSHWLMSHAAPLMRDAERLRQIKDRTNSCPLGSGALAGNAFGVDREFLRAELGFATIAPNSIDAVCDRDFVAEFLSWAALMLAHLSQMSEDLIVANMLRTVEMDDAYATGSSLMPQKKNPDALELLRGKAGVTLGRATGMMAVLKGLPRAYNKDLQEDKVPLFETMDTVEDCLKIAAGVLETLRPNPTNMLKTLCPEMLATDLADYLVRKGVPFRETHHISGACVRLSEDTATPLDKLTLDQLKQIDARFEEDVLRVWDYEVSVERKSSAGGTARKSVLDQIRACQDFAKGLMEEK